MESSGIVKQASATDLDKAAALLETIRSENPSLWPNGLTVGHFRPGNLWLIQKSAASEPVGFVGWQERNVDSVPTGYYSIGVLPEYRHRGIAKQAVARLLATKSSGVTRVRALVVPGNTPSEHLARSLRVPIEKQAGLGDIVKGGLKAIAKSPYTYTVPGGAYATSVYQDNQMHPDEPWSWTNAFRFGTNDKNRNQATILNSILGGTGAATATKGIKEIAGSLKAVPTGSMAGGLALAGAGGAGMTVGPITKDLLIHLHKPIEGVSNLTKELPGKLDALTEAIRSGKAQQAVTAGLGTGGALTAAGILAAGLGLGGYGIAKAIRDKPVGGAGAQGGRIKVTLPTRNPTDTETSVDLPFDEFSALSPALRGRIERDTRRRLYGETNARTRRIGTQPLTAVS